MYLGKEERREERGKSRTVRNKTKAICYSKRSSRGSKSSPGAHKKTPAGPLRTPAKGGRHHHFQARPRRSYYDDPKRLNFRVRMGSGALLLVWSRSLVEGRIVYSIKFLKLRRMSTSQHFTWNTRGVAPLNRVKGRHAVLKNQWCRWMLIIDLANKEGRGCTRGVPGV